MNNIKIKLLIAKHIYFYDDSLTNNLLYEDANKRKDIKVFA